MLSIECVALDNGKKTDTVVTILKDCPDQVALLRKRFTVQAKIHLNNNESFEQALHISVKKGATIASSLLSLERAINCSFKVFIDGNPVDAKEKIQKVIKSDSKVLLYATGGGKSRP